MSQAPKVVSLAATAVLFAGGIALAAPPPPPGTRPPAPPPFQVSKVTLQAIPIVYDGVCPATIKFSGKIYGNGPGTVKYIFTRSDGAIDTVVKTLTLPICVPDCWETVSGTWTLGDPIKLPTYTGWETIKILSPSPMESNHANFSVTCSKKQPDLVVKGLDVATTLFGLLTLKYVIANQGDGDAGNSHGCVSDLADPSKVWISGIGPIAAGAESDPQHIAIRDLKSVGVNVKNGVHITADCKHEVAESNENNNTVKLYGIE